MRLIDGDALKQTFCAECTHTLKCSDCDIDYHFEKLAPTIQNWIPCSDKLPETGEYYLVTRQYFGWNCTEYREIDIAEYDFDGWDKANVVAWRELLEPYKTAEQK